MPKKGPNTSLASLIFGFRQKKLKGKKLKTQGKNLKVKEKNFGFFKNISKASYLKSMLCYQILNVERNKKTQN